MHELSLVGDLLEQIETTVLDRGYDRVVGICLEVGDLSGVDPSSIEFCFSELSRGTVCEGAKLKIERQAAQVYCETCKQETALEDPAFWICGTCGQQVLRVTQGRDFLIRDLDVVESPTTIAEC